MGFRAGFRGLRNVFLLLRGGGGGGMVVGFPN